MPFKNVLVALDLSDASVRALRLAIPITREYGAKLTLLHVGVATAPALAGAWAPAASAPLVEINDQMAKEELHGLERLRREEVPDEVDCHIVVREGFVPDEIVEAARTGGHDLVVMGTHGHTGLERLILGSVAEHVIRNCPVPVLVTR